MADRLITYRAAILEALFEEMRRDSNVVVMGEDVGAALRGMQSILNGIAKDPRDLRIWGYGSTFDNVVLRSLFDAAVAAAQPALCLPPHLPARHPRRAFRRMDREGGPP